MQGEPTHSWASEDGHLGVDAYDGEWTHTVWVDDWIAHLHEDVVEAYVAHVQGREGVVEAYQEDREVIVVIAPGLAAEVLGSEAHRWFRERLPPSPP